MGLIDNAKEIADLIKKAGDVELYRKIVELQGEIVALSGDKVKLEKENEDLRKQLELKQAMKFKFPYYYQDDDPNPFCRHCWEASKIAIHLDHGEPWDDRTKRTCNHCQQIYFDGPEGQRQRRPINSGGTAWS